MYRPPHFKVEDPARLQAVIAENRFAMLIKPAVGGVEISHLPLAFDDTAGAHGTIYGHLAKANAHCRVVETAPSVAVFPGPHAYVSPRWYATPALVPTWNYVAVHAWGQARLLDAEATVAALDRLTAVEEKDRPEPWSIADMPGEKMERMLKGIVGFEMPVSRLEGKFKLSQDKSPADRAGVLAALEAENDPLSAATARAMRQATPQR